MARAGSTRWGSFLSVRDRLGHWPAGMIGWWGIGSTQTYGFICSDEDSLPSAVRQALLQVFCGKCWGRGRGGGGLRARGGRRFEGTGEAGGLAWDRLPNACNTVQPMV